LDLEEAISKSNNIISKALTFFDRPGLAFSGGTDSLVLLYLVYPYKQDIDVLFVNTWNQFPETLSYIKKIILNFKFNFHVFSAPENKYSEFKKKYGDTGEFYRECCLYHKIKPLYVEGVKQLKLDCLFTGIRGVEHPERAKEFMFSPRENPHKYWRVHPLLFWSRDNIRDFVDQYELEVNPVYERGYTSLGCVPCTKPNPDPSKHERWGRRTRDKEQKWLREKGYS